MGREKICLEEKKKGRQGVTSQCFRVAWRLGVLERKSWQEEEKKPEEPPMLHFAYKPATQLAVVLACSVQSKGITQII